MPSEPNEKPPVLGVVVPIGSARNPRAEELQSMDTILDEMPWLRDVHAKAEAHYVKADAKAEQRAREESSALVKSLVERGITVDVAQHLTTRLFLTQSLDVARTPDTRPLLVLAGGTGCGKSLAAAWMLMRRKGGRFIPAVDIASLQPRKRAADRERLDELRDLSAILVIDDLGTEPIDDDWRAQLDVLLDQRSGNRRLTVMTTNLAGSDFHDEYGVRLWSRISGLGRYHESTDPDWRQPQNRPRSWL
jgi:DNA replication protein DnaC